MGQPSGSYTVPSAPVKGGDADAMGGGLGGANGRVSVPQDISSSPQDSGLRAAHRNPGH